MRLGSHRPRRHRRINAPGLLLAILIALDCARPALAQTFDFSLPKGTASTQLAAWSKITRIRIEFAPDVPASVFNLMTTNAIRGRMGPYQALNHLLDDTPIIILKERLDVVILGVVASSGSVLLDSQPPPGSTAPAEIARQKALQQSLAPAFAPQVIAGLLAEPSFGPPYAIGLKLGQGRYSVLIVQTPATRAANPAPRVCEAPIEPDLGRRLAEAWRKVVARDVVRRAPGLDGVTYTLAFRQAGVERRRQLWEPPAASAEGQVVTIGQAMRAFCADASPAKTAALTTAVARLELMLGRGQ
ncbi:MAG: hypothetical protein JWM33_1222 [Caulobacteraceae bacterium]|nr:hypothetical protein [Caulobacteraceae bacterium]